LGRGGRSGRQCPFWVLELIFNKKKRGSRNERRVGGVKGCTSALSLDIVEKGTVDGDQVGGIGSKAKRGLEKHLKMPPSVERKPG